MNEHCPNCQREKKTGFKIELQIPWNALYVQKYALSSILQSDMFPISLRNFKWVFRRFWIWWRAIFRKCNAIIKTLQICKNYVFMGLMEWVLLITCRCNVVKNGCTFHNVKNQIWFRNWAKNIFVNDRFVLLTISNKTKKLN